MKKLMSIPVLLFVACTCYFACEQRNDDFIDKESIPSIEEEAPSAYTSSSQIPEEALIVGKINVENGEADILTDRLVPALSDGTPVKFYVIKRTGESIVFVRIGINTEGFYVAEAFPAYMNPPASEGLPRFTHDLILKRITVKKLRLITCEGSCGLCMLKGNGEYCDCVDDIELEDIYMEDVNGNRYDGNDYDDNGNVICSLVTDWIHVWIWDVIRL